jgi:ABC-type dipeptide/oligopeptide/nickel transport system permease component
LLTAWSAVSLTFFALRIGIGDPVDSLLSQGLATAEQAQALRHDLGFDLPLPLQYLRYLFQLLRGDMGTSLYTNRPVSQVIAEQTSATFELALGAFAVALILAIALGVISAWRKRSTSGWLANAIAGLATSLPVAFTGILAILLLSSVLSNFQPNQITGWLQRSFLPVLVLGFASAGGIARVVHAGLRESMELPHMTAARARGIGGARLLFKHGLRPALPPVISMSALQAAFLLTGTVVTETVFARPGLGRLLVTSILQGDYPVAQGIVALAALLYTATGLVADLLSMILDPRLRREA